MQFGDDVYQDAQPGQESPRPEAMNPRGQTPQGSAPFFGMLRLVIVVAGYVKRKIYTLLAIVAVTILAACAGSQWSREGTNPETMREDLTACQATAKIRGRTEFPEILVYTSMEFGGRSSPEDINLKNFTRVRIEYERDCMLERGYHVE